MTGARWALGLCVLGAGLAGPTGTAAAQGSSLGAFHRLSVAAGAGRLTTRDAGTARDGLSFMVAYDVGSDGPVGLRLTGTLLEGRGRSPQAQLGGVGIDVGWAPWRGHVAPYLLAGAGVYALRLDYDAPPGPGRPQHLEQASFSFTGGAGVRGKVGPVTTFVEVRGTAFPNGGDIARAYTPVVLGVRF